MADRRVAVFRRHAARALCAAAVFAALLAPRAARASEVVDVLPLTDRVIMVHFNDGKAIHHLDGHPRTDEQVIVNPLDTASASKAASYQIVSSDDPSYASPRQPVDVGRKSTATETLPKRKVRTPCFIGSIAGHVKISDAGRLRPLAGGCRAFPVALESISLQYKEGFPSFPTHPQNPFGSSFWT